MCVRSVWEQFFGYIDRCKRRYIPHFGCGTWLNYSTRIHSIKQCITVHTHSNNVGEVLYATHSSYVLNSTMIYGKPPRESKYSSIVEYRFASSLLLANLLLIAITTIDSSPFHPSTSSFTNKQHEARSCLPFRCFGYRFCSFHQHQRK